MSFNFDEPVNRKNTNSFKHDAVETIMGVSDTIPMWVADMDFKAPPFIVEALKKRLEHEVFGYSIKPDVFYQSIIQWMKKRHQWEIKREWISFCPGVVAGFTIAVQQLTQPGDKIIVQPPVYFPFFDTVNNTGRQLVMNPLKLQGGRLCFDFDDLIQKIDSSTKLLLLCNPHNPGGSVWTREELKTLSDICLKHNITVVSDEIHADVIYAQSKHTPFASISENAAQNSITVMSHSKTFNVAGLTTSYVVSANKEILVKYNKGLNTPHLHMGNIFGTEALIAAYSHGEAWLQELIAYLKGNIDFVDDFCKKRLHKMKVIVPESTFLIWIDCREFQMSRAELSDFFLHKAKVTVNMGGVFGTEGEGFIRLNVGCPRSTVEKAFIQIEQAYLKHKL